MQYVFVLNLTMKLSQIMQLTTEYYNRDAVHACTEFNNELCAHSDHHHEPDICQRKDHSWTSSLGHLNHRERKSCMSSVHRSIWRPCFTRTSTTQVVHLLRRRPPWRTASDASVSASEWSGDEAVRRHAAATNRQDSRGVWAKKVAHVSPWNSAGRWQWTHACWIRMHWNRVTVFEPNDKLYDRKNVFSKI